MTAAPLVRSRLEQGRSGPAGHDPLSLFYERRSFRPAWTGPAGPLAQADILVAALARAREDGLRPSDYHHTELSAELEHWRQRGVPESGSRRSSGGAVARLVTLDVALSAAYLKFARHLQAGRVDPRTVHDEWRVPKPRADIAGLLQTSLDLGDVASGLDRLRPRHAAYSRLRRALSEYRSLQRRGDWPTFSCRRQLQRGDRGAGITDLVRLLTALGDLGQGVVGEPRYGARIERAVRKFQIRHGLPASGRVDEETCAALRVPLETRIDQIVLNMERWRWLPGELGSRYILVHITDFTVEFVVDGDLEKRLRAIVGRTYRQTPIFSSELREIVFHPQWFIPHSIATEEILPLVQRDPSYLERAGIRALSGEEVPWETLSPERFPYTLVQAPGPANPLGRVKFLFPNPFDVYIHDTPRRDLFAAVVRDFSHGCIRVEDAAALAAHTLAGTPGWGSERVAKTLAGDRQKRVVLREPLRVYVYYWTAWVDEEGLTHFRRDLYDSDHRLRQALALPGLATGEQPDN